MTNLSNIKKKKVTFSKEPKSILKKTTIPNVNTSKQNINQTKITKYTKRKPVVKKKTNKNKNKQFSSYRKTKTKYYKSKKKTNLKKYLVNTNIINKDTKSPNKLIDDLFQICYNNNINVIKYPRFKYNN
tara:strand:- start:1462 stop:1848 length:387 start_codon:yes stop_codon:yes gene_type:complete